MAGYNPFAGTYLEAAGPARCEVVTLDWLRQLVGYPEPAGGLFLSGGSMANLTALAAAKHHLGCGPASSVLRAARTLGLQVVTLASGPDRRLSLDELRQVEQATVVVANAGTTNTGAIDPLPEIAGLCRSRGWWLHVDGAYGAAAVFCERGRRLLAGIEQTDSLALDGHKWLFQPYEMGCLLVRDSALLEAAFHILPPYLEDLATQEVNFCDRGLQLTRSFKALGLWFTLQMFGAEAFSLAVETGFKSAEIMEACLVGRGFTIVSPAQLGILCFAHPSLDDEGHRGLARRTMEDGFCVFSTTVLDSRTVLRACPIHPALDSHRIEALVERLVKLLSRLDDTGAPPV